MLSQFVNVLVFLTGLALALSTPLKSFSSAEIIQNEQTASGYRLNLTVVPLNYRLKVRPVLHDGFEGLPKYTCPSEVTIRVKCIKDGNYITMHQRGLHIQEDLVKVVVVNSGKVLSISSHSYIEERDFYTINLEDSFDTGEILDIYIPYIVNISQTENTGLYLGHYEDPATNKTKYLAATKLEPYHARKVFPLFDEPSLKATWNVVVGRLGDEKYGYHSLSNTVIDRVEPDSDYSGWVWDIYQETVLMPPYLMCFVVSDFAGESIVNVDKNRTVSTWAPRHDIVNEGGLYGAQTGAKILDFFENKFKMDYVLPKLDAVALPQFASGAMENWGLVTYRYEYLVWIPGENTESERRKITQVLGHEIAHQWYGNLVTCAWWSDIWLNEGFARFLQFWAMNHTLPEFEIEEAFVNNVNQLAMEFDQGPKTHPVKNSAESPTESAAAFDRISYEKGAALLKMMEGFLTKQIFEAGIIDVYLQRMKWKSAYQDDLFQALQDAVEQHEATHLLPPNTTIKTIMDTWTLKSGYPVLRVNVVNISTISISQEKFISSAGDSSSNSGQEAKDKWANSSDLWWTPFSVRSAEPPGMFPYSWISPNKSSVTFTHETLNTETLVMVNPDAIGYYRVLYDRNLTNLIIKQLQDDHNVISSSSRSQFIDDYFNLGLNDYIEIKVALEILNYLDKEASSNVWVAVLTHLKPILSKFTQDRDAFYLFKNHFLPRLEGALNIIGLRQSENEKGINVTLRASLLEMACQLELESCHEYATELINEWMSNPQINPFPVDLRASLYCAAVQSSSDPLETQNFLISRFLEYNKEYLRLPLLAAITCTEQQAMLHSLLNLTIESEFLQNYQEHIIRNVAINPVGRILVYDFLKTNLVEGKVSPALFSSIVSTLSSYWNTQNEVDELENVLRQYDGYFDEAVKSSLTESLGKVHSNMQWWSKVGNEVIEWLKFKSLNAKN